MSRQVPLVDLPVYLRERVIKTRPIGSGGRAAIMVPFATLSLSLLVLAAASTTLGSSDLLNTSRLPSGLRVPFRKHTQRDALRDIVSLDRAHANSLFHHSSNKHRTPPTHTKPPAGIPISSIVTKYVVTVNVGYPPTSCKDLLLQDVWTDARPSQSL